MREPTTAYPADRAAALAGVPQSTVHYWAREGILVPSVSAEKLKLWSFADLMGLRTIAWLRRRKISAAGHDIPHATMPKVRRALRALEGLDLSLWTADAGSTVLVDPNGEIIIRHSPGLVRPVGHAGELQTVALDFLDLMAPFNAEDRAGPDLRRPRPRLRIVPGKLAGAPHIERTRLETQAVHALARRGLEPERIVRLYPFTDLEAIREAIDLENQLQRIAA
jgi:uncharacterized protein (DUF433 family)